MRARMYPVDDAWPIGNLAKAETWSQPRILLVIINKIPSLFDLAYTMSPPLVQNMPSLVVIRESDGEGLLVVSDWSWWGAAEIAFSELLLVYITNTIIGQFFFFFFFQILHGYCSLGIYFLKLKLSTKICYYHYKKDSSCNEPKVYVRGAEKFTNKYSSSKMIKNTKNWNQSISLPSSHIDKVSQKIYEFSEVVSHQLWEGRLLEYKQLAR